MHELHTNRNAILLAAVLTALFFGWVAWATCTFSSGDCFDSRIKPGPIETKKVTFIIDGDSFTVEGGEEVRLIGIDAPERGAEHYEQARQFLIELIDGKEVVFEADIEDEDTYDRKLRYAYINGTFVNKELILAGHAKLLTIPPNVKYNEELKEAQKEAKKAKRGIWGD